MTIRDTQMEDTPIRVVTAVLFDLFGTLVDDFVFSVGQSQMALAAALRVPYEPFMQLWRQTAAMRTIGDFQTVEASIEYVSSAMGVKVVAEQMTKAVEIRLRQIKRALDPRAGAVATLAGLKNQGYKVGQLSNYSVEIAILWHETKQWRGQTISTLPEALELVAKKNDTP